MQRASILFLSTVLTVLFSWLLSFALEDIGDLDGPDRGALRAEMIPAVLLQRQADLQVEIAEAGQEIEAQRQDQALVDESLARTEATMQQLMDLHRLSLEKGIDPTASQAEALAESQALFLENQERSQETNTRVLELSKQKRGLEAEAEVVRGEVAVASRPADEEYWRQKRNNDFLIACLKLALLLPLLALVARQVHRHRGKRYLAIWVAAVIATFIQVTLVMHEYFPSEVFKYIAIAAGILIILGFLVAILRRMVVHAPDAAARKAVAEAYGQGRCPCCAFPIQLRVQADAAARLMGAEAAVADREGYTCPSCGTTLFESCAACGANRHALLPWCGSCGTGAEGAAATA